MKKLCHLLWLGTLLVSVSMAAYAQVTPEDEYKQLIKVDQDVQPLGEHPFGENISLYDGTLSFEETDISVPGNGPTIHLGRSLTAAPGPGYEINAQRPFGDWDMEIPRIETMAAADGTSSGWLTSGGTQRCSNFTPPPYASSVGGGGSWAPEAWWYGYHLILSGQDNQTLLPRGTGNPISPTMSGMSFPIVTKQNWMIGCGVTASDGGEGFLAIAPDGTRYTFAHLVYRPWAEITEPSGTTLPPNLSAQSGLQPSVAGGTDILLRNDALMYVTQIQDRFGNTLTYNYSGNNLVSIVASDGRQVTLTYVPGLPLVQTVTVQSSNATPRTWTYSYDTTVPTFATYPTLTGVQLPDGSAWSYQLGAFPTAVITTVGGNCGLKQLPTTATTAVTGSITHPSGLTATFTMTVKVHGRSYVPWDCYGSGSIPAPSSFFPEYYSQYSMTSEVLSGAGMPTETWNYSYSPANESWSNDACATSGTCPATVYTDVVDPDGHDVRTTFSNRFDASEGQLLRTDYYTAGNTSAILRSETNTYANPVGGPWPTAYGGDLQGRDNTAQTEENAPLSQRTTTEEGDSYLWQALTFNSYAQTTEVKRSNSIAGQTPIEEATAYLNDTNLWVLGLPQTVTNVTTGETENANTYYPNDTLQSRARFGETLMNYTFNSAGQLASFTDGDNHTTSLGNYYRGIPQSISYPDSTSESLAVDDFGQITSITDQATHTTGYSYDPVGRLAGITYPTGDSVAWNPTTFTYTFVTSAERGIAADHWRRTTTTGNAVTTTYFDAELRPVLSDTAISGTSGSDITTGSAYDWKGQPLFASYPVSGSPALSALTTGTHHTYDALERLIQTQQNSELGTLTTTIAYLSGAEEQVTDPMVHVTTTHYQVFDEPSYHDPILVLTPGGTPHGITQTIARDIYGNPLSITQSGMYGTESDSLTKTFTYDSYHRLCRSTEPESGSTVMAYDGANNLAWSADGLAITGSGCGQSQVAAAAQITRTYDPMNRVLTIVPPAGTQSTTYTYDALGNIASARSGMAYWWAARNTRNDITGEILQLTGQSAWGIGYTYDANDHLSQLHYPGASEYVNVTSDALGRPTQVGSYVSGVSYFPNGSEQSYALGNGISALVQQNTRQLTSGLSYALGGTSSFNEAYVYDGDSDITTVTDLVNGKNNQTLGYDGQDRLTSASAPNAWGAETYAYDAYDNQRQRVSGGNTYNINIDANNRLISRTIGSTPQDTYTTDAAGDITGVDTSLFTYDAKHQMLSLSGVETYAYDASGRRVMKAPAAGGAAAATFSFYNHAGQLMYAYNASSGQGTNYIYLNGKLIARHAGSTITYVLTDRLGSPVREANTSGTVTASFSYRPFGGLFSGPEQNQPGFTGQVYDPETSFVYMQARYYAVGLGRFFSPDPVGPAAGDAFSFNRYAYATNNPIINSDPTGRQSASDFAKLNSCAGACSLVMMDGQWQAVGSAQAATSMLAQQKGGTISDYTPATGPQTAVAMDNVNIVAATTSKLSGGAFVPADIVDESSAVLALALDPSWGRLFTVATAGMFSGLKVEAKGNEAATAAIERADRANTAKDLLTATQPGSTNNSTQPSNSGSPQQTPSSTAPQSPPAPQQRNVTPTLHPLGE